MTWTINFMRILNLSVSLIFAFFLAAPRSNAQQPDTIVGQQPSGVENNKRNEFGVWGSISFDATTWIGYTPGARFGNVGLRYGRVLAANRNLAFSWTIDAVPVAVLSVKRFTIVPTGSGTFAVRQTRDHTYGAGLSPIGLKLNFRRSHLLQPYASGSGGFLYFSKQVPVPGASQFNFTFDFGGGVDIVRDGRRAISVGYKYLHISNGYTAAINPGVDGQMIQVGYSIRR
jgi:Lipid A 3-O-deacylase (PagL)